MNKANDNPGSPVGVVNPDKSKDRLSMAEALASKIIQTGEARAEILKPMNRNERRRIARIKLMGGV